MAKKKISFEQALTRLEEIVSKMEDGSTTLDDSVALYKEGLELSLICSDNLDAAEKEVSLLAKTADGILKKTFESDF